MTEQEKKTAEKLRNSSEFIKTAESFAEYAHKEWILDCAGQRALLMCCVDRTVPDGIGSMGIATGNGNLISAALMQLQEDGTISRIFRDARLASDAAEDYDEMIRDTRKFLRSAYGMVALTVLWTLCIIAFQIAGTAHWITTVSNLLLIVWVGYRLGYEIKHARRKMKRLTKAARRERENRLEQKMRSFMDALTKRNSEEDDEDE